MIIPEELVLDAIFTGTFVQEGHTNAKNVIKDIMCFLNTTSKEIHNLSKKQIMIFY